MTSGDSPRRGNPKLFDLIEDTPKEGPSPTIWAWPEIIDYLKVAGQPVQGPWPPHQNKRPDPSDESLPVAIPDPESTAPQQQHQQAPPPSSPSPDSFGQA